MFCLHAYVHARCFMRPKQDFGSPGIGATDGCEPPCECKNQTWVQRTANALSH